MARIVPLTRGASLPSPRAVLELLKPVTWFAPMWAYMCGIVSSGLPLGGRWHLLVGGVVLAGPLLCATTQAVNDWFDRHVDAINEPNRPIPSGRIPGRWGLWIAFIWTSLSLAFASLFGAWVLSAAALGLALGWAYSAPPFRLKQSGWWGPAAVALCYEGLAWFTGAAVMKGGLPDGKVILLAALYSIGAHGIMTLNDFKAVEGDRQLGIRSLPVTLGVGGALRVACLVMTAPQLIVVALLAAWGLAPFAAIVGVGLVLQVAAMARLARDPVRYAPWYNMTGVTLFVLGMLAAAIGAGHFLSAAS